MHPTARIIQLLEVADPTPLQAIVEKTLAEQQAQLKRQADEISLLKTARDRLKEALREKDEALRKGNDKSDHQLSVLAGGREILARHTFEGIVRAVTDCEVEISVETAATTSLLRIGREKFAPEHVLAVGDHITVDNFCTRAPQSGTSLETMTPVGRDEELADLVEGLRRRSPRGPTQL
jgi:3-methyladenine DNA glycosylase/8-oxoguanine DNA glycosylase